VRFALLLVLLVTVARADDRLRQYDGRIVISPDPIPTVADDLPGFLKAQAAKDGHYELIKGPPWKIHLIGFLAKDPGAAPVKLELTEKGAKTALHSLDVSAKRKIVVSSTTATTEAGFEANKTYLVQLVAGGAVLAKAELLLRN
jgi:hypothetical protein